MRNKTVLLLAGALGLLALPAFAFAEDVATAPACKSDIQRLCKKVKQGEGRIEKCLQDNAAKITVGCKESMDEMAEIRMIRDKVRNFRTTCRNDLDNLCVGVPQGKMRQVKCLQAHASELSAPCRTTLESEGVSMQTAKAETAPAAAAAPSLPAASAPAQAVIPEVPAAGQAPADVKSGAAGQGKK